MYPYNLPKDENLVEAEVYQERNNRVVLPPPFPGQGFSPRPNDQKRPPRPGHQNPIGAPPEFTPQPRAFAVDSFAIRQCVGNFTYIWLKNGRNFWFYPSFVGRKSVAGYKWTRFGWTYLGVDLDLIESFFCNQ